MNAKTAQNTLKNPVLSLSVAPPTAQTAEGFLKSGFEHLEQQDYEKAMADFEAALRILPEDTLAKSGIETVRRRMG